MQRGKFIVIEGGDGAGKDTQIELLKHDFSGDRFVYTRDPGGTEIGNKLRELTQYGKSVAKETELLLFLASRAQLVQELILPALKAGKHVISNRFDLSTTAYQIYGRERLAMIDFVRQISAYARDEAMPDLVVLLDVKPEVGLQRLMDRGEKLSRFDQEKLAFHERVRQGYLESAKEYRYVMINANQPIREVYQEVYAEVVKVLR